MAKSTKSSKKSTKSTTNSSKNVKFITGKISGIFNDFISLNTGKSYINLFKSEIDTSKLRLGHMLNVTAKKVGRIPTVDGELSKGLYATGISSVRNVTLESWQSLEITEVDDDEWR